MLTSPGHISIRAECKPVKMAELESSLTAMDWLPRLNVGGALSGNINGSGVGQNNKVLGGHTALRKPPNSPLDTTATLNDCDVRTQQKDGKPPYSYANLITFAINSSNKKKMTLSDIYAWICENFPYYKDAGNGWKVCSFNLRCHSSCDGLLIFTVQ